MRDSCGNCYNPIATVSICGGSSSIGRASDCGSRPDPFTRSHKNPVNMRLFRELPKNCFALVRVVLCHSVTSFFRLTGSVRAEIESV